MADLLTKIEGLAVLVVVAVLGYLAWQNREAIRSIWCAIPGTNCKIQVTPDSPDYDKPSVTVNPDGSVTASADYAQPDWVYPDHPFQGTVLDPVYDAGWNFMGWLRTSVISNNNEGLVW